ncbi:MAG: type II secretion system F family protein [Telluria sp.]
MPFYAYKGRNVRGELMQGALEAADQNAVADQLFATGVTPIEIKETRQTSLASGGEGFFEKLMERKPSSLDVQLFSRQMATLLKSGVPIMRGLGGLQESAINKSFAKVIKDLREALDSGRELSSAMRRHPNVFDNFYLSMVRIGEMTGQLDGIFRRLFEHMEFERDMRERVKQATRYPMFVITAMAIAIVIVNVLVIPQFVKVFEALKADLPLMTRILIASSNFFVHAWQWLALGVTGAVIAIRRWIATPQGRFSWDRMKLRIPIAGKIVTKATMARFARSFAMASRAGVPIVQALSVVAQTTDNAYLGARVEQMRDGVERGESILRTAVAAGVFTPIVLQMIAVGEESGSLDEMMEEIAVMYEREVDYELKTLSAQIEPILITFLGALVLVLALGIFLPMWDLGRAALKK